MKNVAKIAVSVPAPTLAALERTRRRLRRSRSAIVSEALEQWLAERSPSEEDERYTRGYLRRPERVDEAAALAGAVTAGWEPWE